MKPIRRDIMKMMIIACGYVRPVMKSFCAGIPLYITLAVKPLMLRDQRKE